MENISVREPNDFDKSCEMCGEKMVGIQKNYTRPPRKICYGCQISYHKNQDGSDKK